MAAKPFLKWVGGKRKLVPDLIAAMRTPLALRGRYHEPFLGGGALFFELEPRRAFLSDMNAALVETYIAVRDHCDLLVESLRPYQTRLDSSNGEYSDLYYAARDLFNAVKGKTELSPEDRVELATLFIVLNRTGFNGLYRENKSGAFNTPAGRYKRPKCLREDVMRDASRALQSAEIAHGDFGGVLERAEPGDIVYFDPPYIPLSDTADFTAFTAGGFDHDAQVRLAEVFRTLSRRGVMCLLSNSDTPGTRALYEGYEILPVTMPRSVNSRGDKRGRVGEVIVRGGFPGSRS